MASARILVADDHAETRALITSLLKSEFDIIAAVADGQAAADATAALRPDVVVLDIAMPRLNGFEAAAIIVTCRAVRRHDESGHRQGGGEPRCFVATRWTLSARAVGTTESVINTAMSTWRLGYEQRL